MSNRNFYITVVLLKWAMIAFIFWIISYGVFVKDKEWWYYCIWLVATITIGQSKVELPDDGE